MQFKGTKNYISTDDLSMAVNASMALERPLLIKGEPGTGKTLLAEEVAKALKMDPLSHRHQIKQLPLQYLTFQGPCEYLKSQHFLQLI